MTKFEALQTIGHILEESFEYFEYFDTSGDGDEYAEIYWEIKDVISHIEKAMEDLN